MEENFCRVDIDIHVMQKVYRKKLEKCPEIAEGNPL